MTTTIKITELTNIGANLSSSTVIPVVNMAGTPTTEKTILGNIANVVLAGAGGNYVSAAKATTATTANTVLTNAQPNITSMGNLTGLTVSNATGIVNFSNTANISLGNVSNLHITGGTIGQILSTDGAGNLSWTSDTTTYGNSNVVTLLSGFGSNTITTTGNVSVGNIIGNGQALTNIAGANVSGFVANANVSNTAYAVAGANVSGFVANANVSNTAYAVAGANVSGFVANANVSNTAFSVAAANVSGLGNIATINLTGSNSNVLYGNGVFAAVAGGGANTGNVTFSDQVVIGTGSNDGSGGLYLAPGNNSIANSAVQYLRVRGGDVATHIHLDTGNNAYYDQYFGDDGKYVKLANTGNVVIGTDDANGNQYSWTFSTDGNLDTPSNLVIGPGTGSGSRIFQYDEGLEIVGEGANSVVLMGWTANTSAPDSVATIAMNYPSGGEGNILIAVGNNATTVNYWLFGNDGNLTLPNSATIIAPNVNDLTLRVTGQYNICTLLTGGSGYGGGGSSSAISGGTGTGMIVGYGYGLSGQVVNVGVTDPGTGYSEGDVLTMTAGNGGATFVITKYNTAANAGNNNTAPTDWTFGVDGNITLPNNYSSINYANGSPYGGGGGTPGGSNTQIQFNDSGNFGANSGFTFDSTTGNISIPGTIISGSTITIDNRASGNGADINLYSADDILIQARDRLAGSTTEGGDINIFAGASAEDGDTSGGDVIIEAGDGGASNIDYGGAGGFVRVEAGQGGAASTEVAGQSAQEGGGLTLRAGDAGNNNGNIDRGSEGGDVHIESGDSTSNTDGGSIYLTTGVSGDGSGGGTWQFDGDGDITFPDATVQTTAWPGSVSVSNLVNGAYTASLGAGGEFTIPGNITLPNGAVIKDTAGNSVAFGEGAGTTSQGVSAVAIGKDAGTTTQGQWAVAIGNDAGNATQGAGAVAIGVIAGQTTQGVTAVAVGFGAGANTQGSDAVAIGTGAGQFTQGSSAVAIGTSAGRTSQGNNSIILNATGANLNQTTANTFTVAPVRNDTSNIAEVMFYNTTSKEVTYGNTLSVAGNISANNFTGNGGGLSNVATKISSSWTLASGTNTVNISVPLNGTYTIWVNGNIPNGIITYTATAVVTNTNVPVLGEQYGWYYALGNALVLTSIPNQFTGTVGSISTVNTYSGNTANVFTFGITNNSGNTAVVNYGYTKL